MRALFVAIAISQQMTITSRAEVSPPVSMYFHSFRLSDIASLLNAVFDTIATGKRNQRKKKRIANLFCMYRQGPCFYPNVTKTRKNQFSLLIESVFNPAEAIVNLKNTSLCETEFSSFAVPLVDLFT